MSGNPLNLETELLIGFDLLAHSIQKALNCHNIQDDKHPTDRYNRPKLAILEYSVEKEAIIKYPDDEHDGMPNMGAPFPLYNQEVLYQYTCTDEEERKL